MPVNFKKKRRIAAKSKRNGRALICSYGLDGGNMKNSLFIKMNLPKLIAEMPSGEMISF